MSDPSDDPVAARLRAALDLDAPRREGVDMSSQAITSRLEELAEMSRVCLELARLADPRRGA